jgi:flavin-dependent dehydrogenase
LQVWDAGDPIATLPRELVADGLALAGGCAGQSGIAFGIAAGAICGRVAAGATAYADVRAARLSDYPKAWRCALGADYRRGRFALEAVRRMRDAELDRVAQVFEGHDLTPMLGRSTAGLAARVLGACLRRDPGALGGLRALARR